MKHYFLLLILFFPVAIFAQTEPPTQVFGGRLYEFKNALRADSIFLLPRKDTLGQRPSLIAAGALTYRMQDSSVYVKGPSGWQRIATGSGLALDSARRSNDTLYFRKTTGGELAVKMDYYNTSQINTLLNSKVNTSDTASMLSPYLRKVDTTAMLSKYLRKADTLTLSNRINIKLNVSDTAGMLLPYLRKVDTTSMLSKYLRKTDTVTLSNRINLKENLIAAGTTAQYRRGDKTWQTLNVAAVSGLQDSLNKKINTADADAKYLQENETVNLSGDITGSGKTAIVTTLKSTGTAGIYTKVTTDAQGRVTSGTTLSTGDIPSLSATYILVSQKGAANGVATLDGSGKVPLTQLPTSGAQYKGTWDASTNTPTLADGTGAAGWYYRVTVGGTRNLGSGNITFIPGDDVIHNGSIWQRVPTANAVNSVNTKTGDVVINQADVGLSNVDNTADIDKIISNPAQAVLDTKANSSIIITAGSGLTGGGNLTANRTIAANFGSAAGTIAQGNDSRILNGQTAFGWGNHASAGYLTTTTGDARYPVLTGSYNNPSWLTGLPWSKIAGTPTTLAGYGITDAIQNQFAIDQPATFRITGSATTGSGFISNKGQNTEHYTMRSGNNTRWNIGITSTETGSGNVGSDFVLWRYTDAGGFIGQAMLVSRSSGNVGIGTATPAEKLEVAGNIKTTSTSIGGTFSNWSGPGAGGYVLSTSGGSARWVNRTVNTETGTDYVGADWILERRNNAGAGVFTAMYISRANGNVGIGTTTPGQKLTVAGDIYSSSTVWANNYTSTGSGEDVTITAPVGHATRFFVGASEKVTISQDGILAVGIPTPSGLRASPLQVAGNIWSEDAYVLGTGTVPTAEFGLSGPSSAFLRTMGTGDITFQTSASNVRARVNGTTGNFEINNQLKISGGSPAAGKVLTSDASGLATWTSGVVQSVKVITSNYTATTNDYVIINRSTSVRPTLTLPAASANTGRMYMLVDEAGTTELMIFSPGITKKGVTYTDFNNAFFMNGPRALIQSDGANWVILMQ